MLARTERRREKNDTTQESAERKENRERGIFKIKKRASPAPCARNAEKCRKSKRAQGD